MISLMDSPALLWVCKPDGTGMIHNPAWCDHYGMSLEKAAEGWRYTVHPDDVPALLEPWLTSLATAETYEVEVRRRDRTGEYNWYRTRAVPVFKDGKIVKWSGANTEVTLSKAVGRLALVATTNALHLLQQPAVALDRRGFVVETNEQATILFDDELRIRDRRLFVRDKKAKSALSRFVDQLRVTPDSAALLVEPITVHRDTKRPVIIRVLPVDGEARSPFLGARAILTLTDLELKPRPDPKVFAQVFGITPSQARLATLLATGISLDEVATELGIAIETARNHLKSIFANTGTHRQGELVALLSRL